MLLAGMKEISFDPEGKIMETEAMSSTKICLMYLRKLVQEMDGAK